MNKNPAAVALGKMKSAKKARAARLNGTLGGRPRNPVNEIVQIYAIVLNDSVLYIGSTINLAKRIRQHSKRGNAEIQTAIHNGATFKILEQSTVKQCRDCEIKLIKKYSDLGQCLLNRNISGVTLKARRRFSGLSVKHIPSGRVFKSKSAAARAIKTSVSTIKNEINKGGVFELA